MTTTKESYCEISSKFSSERQTLPYKSAASSTTNTLSKEYDSFSLNCPHVADANSDNVRIEVTWTLNDTIWLKIDEGEKKIFNRLTTFTRRVVAGKTVLRVLLNNGRYFFDYDELTGDFAMEIRPVNVYEDAGVWQCHVTVYQRGNTHTLTSRSRVKVPHGHRSHGARHPTSTPRPAYYYLPIFQQIAEREAWSTKKQNKVTSFTRNEQELVQISRDEAIRPKAVVFDRQPQSSQNRHSSHALASIDYEMSIDQPDDDEFYTPRSRVRTRMKKKSNALER
ncbi:hypothetical protein Q1695_003485 [Nippostrongylus brasiliensis]|nr:hypothetical protein Q1695_003485 [Nippostrongylus brasiliensis]